MKRLSTKFTKTAVPTANTVLKRKAFLDTLLMEAVEDSYEFKSVGEAINALTGKFALSYDEIKYLKKEAEKQKIKFVEDTRKANNA